MKSWILGVALFGFGVAHAATGLQDFGVSAGDQNLTVWSRRSTRARGVVVLVHGRTWSARTAFDFDAPNARGGNRSLLKSFDAFHSEVTSSYDSPKQGNTKNMMAVDGKYLGAFAPGQKPRVPESQT